MQSSDGPAVQEQPLTDGSAAPAAAQDGDHPEPNGSARVACAALAVVAAVGTVVQLGFDVDVIAGIAFVAVLAVIAAIDLEQLRVPNRIVIPASAGALLWQVAFHRSDLTECLIAGAAAGVFFAVASVLSRGAVGMGDAKLALLIGLMLGYGAISAVFLATIIGAVAAAMVLWRGGTEARKTPIAYAPFLAAGAAAALVFGVASPLT